METVRSTSTPSKTSLWIGWIISGLCILFLLFDAITKVIKEEHTIKASVQLGWPEHSIQGIGIVLLISTILYLIPRTSILGAVLLTGYLGGAIAIMVRAEQQLYFALVFGLLVWLGLYLRDEKLRGILPLRKGE
jgi:hypothetical protein